MAFIRDESSMTTNTHSITSTPCDNVLTQHPSCLEKAELSNSLFPTRKLDENAVDDLAAILWLERTHYMPALDYIRYNEGFENLSNKLVNEKSRYKICAWAMEVADYWGYDREVISIMFFYVDRMCAITAKRDNRPVSAGYFQHVSVASLYLAIKVHGEVDDNESQDNIKPSIDWFVGQCRGVYSSEDITALERTILSTLEWHVNPPTMLCFISTFLRFLPNAWGSEPVDNRIAHAIYEFAKYLTELSVLDSYFALQFKSSEIAYAAILCALDEKQHTFPFPYESRIAFQKKVAAATSLTPKTKAVRFATFALKKILPSQFRQQDYEDINIPVPTGGLSRRSSSAGSEGGTTSPVCVCEPLSTVRDQKRTRLTYE